MPRWLRRPKSGWGWAGLGFAGLALLILVVNEVAIRVTSRMLEEKLRSVAAIGGPGSSLDEILGPTVDREKDAAIPLLRAAAFGAKLNAAIFAKYGAAGIEDPKNRACQNEVAAAVEADPSYERDLAAADRMPDYRSPAVIVKPISNVMLPHLQQFRELVRVESIRARGLAAQGRRDQACQLMLRQMRLARRWTEKEPFVISLLVGIAVRHVSAAELNRMLRGSRLPSEVYDAVEGEAAEEKFASETLRKSLTTERLMCEEMHDSPPLGFLRNRMLAAWANTDKLFFLELLQKGVEAVDGPGASLDEIEGHLKRSTSSLGGYGRILTPGTAMYLPALRPMFNAVRRHGAMCRCLRVVNAAARLGLAKPSLAELRLPPAATIDPFDDRPLRMMHRPEGFVVYSVGDNLVDDGGAIDSKTSARDVGLGP